MRNQLNRGLHLAYASLSALVFSISAYHFGTGLPSWQNILAGAVLGLLAYGLCYLLVLLVESVLARISLPVRRILLAIGGALLIAQSLRFGWPTSVYYPAALAVVLLLLFMVWGLANWSKKRGTALAVLLPMLLLGAGLTAVLVEGHDPFPAVVNASGDSGHLSLAAEGFPNPALPGVFEVEAFTYGSGTDQRRPEYADGVRYQTATVDATRMLPEWKSKKKKWREQYWGFGADAFPLNGRVYRPKDKGLYPLVLVVHGNHSMIDYSDGGYAYLGELLASRGMIVVSVDENFINGHWSGDFRGREMPTRAWLLLKHLQQWDAWNTDVEHELFGQVDMSRIMLVGHSRGGEAVSIAAAFNELPHYPDDAQEVFDFGFDITGVVSIAPTDYRYHRQINLQNINYLSLQGSYDADETSFWGLRPYHRLRFTDSLNYIKAGVYVHRANHGQFNSSWGRTDFGGTFARLLNTQPLMSGEDQREVAKLFISAFAETIFRDRRAYQSLFLAPEVAAADWLPAGEYLGRFTSSRSQMLQDFEEDIDLRSGSFELQLEASNVQVWREENLSARDGGSQENNAVVLGWDYGEKIATENLATYTISLPDSLPIALDSFQHIIMDVGLGRWSDLEDIDATQADSTELDFTIELVSANGEIGVSSLGQSGHLPAPALRSHFMKLPHLNQQMFSNDREIQMETFALPMVLFQTQASSIFNWRELQQIRFIFDQNPRGVVVIDNIRLGWD